MAAPSYFSFGIKEIGLYGIILSLQYKDTALLPLREKNLTAICTFIFAAAVLVIFVLVPLHHGTSYNLK